MVFFSLGRVFWMTRLIRLGCMSSEHTGSILPEVAEEKSHTELLNQKMWPSQLLYRTILHHPLHSVLLLAFTVHSKSGNGNMASAKEVASDTYMTGYNLLMLFLGFAPGKIKIAWLHSRKIWFPDSRLWYYLLEYLPVQAPFCLQYWLLAQPIGLCVLGWCERSFSTEKKSVPNAGTLLLLHWGWSCCLLPVLAKNWAAGFPDIINTRW